MKKLYSYLCLISLGFILVLNIYHMNNIKKVNGTNLKNIDYTNYLNVTGEFINADSEEIMFSYPIYIKEVFVKENSNVLKNQALFSIDKEKMQEMLSEYNYTNTPENLANEISVLPETVYSNSEGYITGLNIENDKLMMANTKLLSISKTNNMLAKFTVSQSDFGKISVGDKVYITSLAFKDKVYEGEINSETAIIYEEVSALGSNVSIDIFADIYNIDEKIADGLQLTARIEETSSVNINILEYEYINQDENGEFVYILKDGIAKKEYIISGIETQEGIEILNDFNVNTIFINGDIQEFDRVVIVN